MSPNQAGGGTHTSSPDRLNGWKEIAAFLSKGVRTVQRWERDYGLPIHRLGREGGEIIFASRSELESWMRANASRARQADLAKRAERDTPLFEQESTGSPATTVPAAPAEGPAYAIDAAKSPKSAQKLSRTWRWLVAGASIVVLGAAFAWLMAYPQPASWKAEGSTLHIYNRLGRELWHKSIFEGLAEELQAASLVDKPGGKLALKDIDGDGSVEVLLAAAPPDKNPDETAFYLFNSDGTPRKVVRPDRRFVYGDASTEQLPAGPPWTPSHIFLIGHSVFVVFIHVKDFPTLLLELDALGDLVHEYWSDGYIETVSRLQWQGRDALFVGGTDNETKGGALAIFTSGHAQGAAPSENPKYRCHGCPPGPSFEFVTFPRRCIANRPDFDGTATVDEIQIEDGQRLHVQVGEGPRDRDGWVTAGVLYNLGPDLSVIQAEPTMGLLQVHDALFKAGKLSHQFGAQDQDAFFPVRHWLETRWVDLPAQARR